MTVLNFPLVFKTYVQNTKTNDPLSPLFFDAPQIIGKASVKYYQPNYNGKGKDSRNALSTVFHCDLNLLKPNC